MRFHISLGAVLLCLCVPHVISAKPTHKKEPTVSSALFQAKQMLVQSRDSSSNNPQYAIKLIDSAMVIARRENSLKLLADAYIEYAYNFDTYGLVAEASDYVFKAEELYRKINDKAGQSEAFNRIAFNKLKSRQFESVMPHLYAAKKLAEESGDSTAIANNYHMLGAAHNWINEYCNWGKRTITDSLFYVCVDSAIFYNLKAIEIREKIGDKHLFNSYNNLGMVYFRKAYFSNRDYGKAIDTHEKSLILSLKSNNLKGIASSYQELADIHAELGEPRKAITLLLKSLKLAIKIKYVLQQEACYTSLSNNYSKLGKIDSAFYFYRMSSGKSSFIVSERNKMTVTLLDKKYQLHEKEEVLKKNKHEIATRDAELKFHRLLFVVIFVVTAMGIVFAIVITSLYKKYKKQSAINMALVREQNHRVKNNLQAVSALLELQALKTENADARTAIEESSQRIHALSLIQKRLYGNEVKMVNLDDFVRELATNLLMSFDIEPKIGNLQINTPLVDVDCAIPLGLIINELITNSCKHAWLNHPNPHFDLKIVPSSPHTLALTYVDNGKGFDAQTLFQTTSSFGLQLIDMQVKQLKGSYKWASTNGSAIHIEFPIKNFVPPKA